EAARPHKFNYPYNCSENNKKHLKINCDADIYIDYSDVQIEIAAKISEFVNGQINDRNEIVDISKPILEVKKQQRLLLDEEWDFIKEYIDPTSASYDMDEAKSVMLENGFEKVHKEDPLHDEIKDF